MGGVESRKYFETDTAAQHHVASGSSDRKGAYPHGGVRPKYPHQRPPKPRSSPPDGIDLENAVPEVMVELVRPILMLTEKLVNVQMSSNVKIECHSAHRRRTDIEDILKEIVEQRKYLHGLHKFYMRQLQDKSQPQRERETPGHPDSATSKHIQSRTSTLVSQKSAKGTASYAKSLIEENIKLQHRLESDTRQILIEETSQLIKASRDKEELVAELIDRNSALIDRLAAEMDAKRSQDECALENISIRNRPLKVAEEYTLLTSNAWLDAKTELDRFFGEDEQEENKIKLLCSTLMEAEKHASKMYDNFTSDMNKRLEEPLNKIGRKAVQIAHGKCVVRDIPVKGKGAGATELPINIETTVCDFLKTKADYADLTNLCEVVRADITQRKETKAFFHPNQPDQVAFTDYIKQCSRLGWKMAIQRPRMRFYCDQSAIGKPFKRGDEFELAWGSRHTERGAVVRCYQYPLLFYGNNVIVKGSVFVM